MAAKAGRLNISEMRKLINKKAIDKNNVIDTLEIARSKFPGAQNSLDSLCKRFNVDNSQREKHNALIDCQLLKEVYVNLLDQKEPKLNLENVKIIGEDIKKKGIDKNKIFGQIIKPSIEELELHKQYLKSNLSKNNYN